MMNDEMNLVLRGNTLCTDGDAHLRLRRIVVKPLTATSLKSLREEVTAKSRATGGSAGGSANLLCD